MYLPSFITLPTWKPKEHRHCLQASDSDFEDRVTLFGHDKDKDNDNDKDKDFVTWALSIEHCGHQITV